MVQELRPIRGGFLKPFGCGEFIRDYLMGKGPYGSATIDPNVGSPQTDIFSEYKDALHRAWAEDMVAREEEKRALKEQPPYTIEEADERTQHWMRRIPMKFSRMRYHSFLIYFGMFKRLGWVEATDREEPSTVQNYYPPAPPRRYYRLTSAGRMASPEEVADPLTVLYGYPPAVRSARNHKYIRSLR